MKCFDTYEQARAWAQREANALSMDVGLEKMDRKFSPWHVFLLPSPAKRQGHELRCEVVRPEVLK